MSEFFERNCQALASEQANQRLLERVMQTAPATDIEVFETGDGSLGIVQGGVAIHNLTGAVLEAQQLVSQYCKPNKKGMHVLFGLGLGYPLAELSAATKAYPESIILVFEPNLPLLRFVLENVDIAAYCNGRRLIINNDAYEFFTIIQEFYIWKRTELDITILPSTLEKFKDSVTDVMRRIPELIESQQQALQVGLTLSESWVTHFVKLLPHWPKTQHFEKLDQLAPGKPAVVVSAGPSLDKALEQLQKIQDQVFIIAVARAVRPLLNAGIMPDFIASIDYEGSIAQIKNLPTSIENCHFLVGPYTEEEVIKVPHKSSLMVNMSRYPLVPWVNDLLGKEQVPVAVLGTVSYLGLQAAYTMGCNPIILLGQDFAFTKENQYAQGALNTEQKIEDGHLIIAESPSYAGTKLELINVKGQQGEDLLSTTDYMQYRSSFQSFAELSKRNNPDRQLINASTGGIQIDGFENMPLQDAFKQDTNLTKLTKEEKQSLLQCLDVTFNNDDQKSQYEKLAGGVSQLIGHLESLHAVIDENLKILKKGAAGSLDGWHKLIPEYEPVKKKLQKLIVIDPLIGLVMGKPSYHLNENVNKNANNWHEQKENLNHTIEFLEGCKSIFQGQFYGTLQNTHQRLLEAAQEYSPVSSIKQ